MFEAEEKSFLSEETWLQQRIKKLLRKCWDGRVFTELFITEQDLRYIVSYNMIQYSF